MEVDPLLHHPQAAPKVLTWYRVYCVLMVLLYLLVAVLGIVFVVFSQQFAADDPELSSTDALIMGWMFFAVGIGLVAPFAAALALPRRRWVWIYHLVMICIGLTSACCLPVTIPLLIFWIKPETKAWFDTR
jgi:cell division protein FtsW (lipid II flippase)